MGWEDSEDWLHLSWATSAVLFISVIVVVVSATPAPTEPDLPAWVQAVGSIGAIWFAGRSVILQGRTSDLRDMESLEGCVGAAKREISTVSKMLLQGPGRLGALRAYQLGRLERVRDTLQAFPVQQLGSSKAPRLVVGLCEVIDELIENLPAYADNGAHDYAGTHEIELAGRAKSTARKAHRKVVGWAEARRGRRDRWWFD